MRAMPIRYVSDVDGARRFYEALGFRTEVTNRTKNWVELAGDESWIALHEGGSGVELTFEAREPIERVAERLHAAGHDVTEYDRELYT